MGAHVNTETLAGSGAIDRARPTKVVHDITSADQLECLNADRGIPLKFTPPGKRLQLAMTGSQSKSLHVWRTDSDTGFLSTPTMSAGLMTIRFVNRGVMARIDQRGSDLVVGFDQALLASFDHMRSEQATPGFSAVTATMSPQALLNAYRSLFGICTATLPLPETVLDIDTPGLRAVRSTVATLHQQLSAPFSGADLVTPLLEELLLYQFVGSWPSDGMTSSSDTADATDRAVKKVMNYIEENLSQSITVSELASIAGISARVLQKAFIRRVGCSPIKYLISRRLDRVRSDLYRFQYKTVREIAQNWGFIHMSDFARRFRERFGELPSSRVN